MKAKQFHNYIAVLEKLFYRNQQPRKAVWDVMNIQQCCNNNSDLPWRAICIKEFSVYSVSKATLHTWPKLFQHCIQSTLIQGKISEQQKSKSINY